MTEQTIPAEKVREILKKLVDDGRGCPEQTLGAVEDSLRALFPAQQPTTGLLGRWAKHPEYGDVMCAWDKPGSMGVIPVRWMAENEIDGLCGTTVPLDSLTFPHQATRPADVPAGEAWLVDVDDLLGESYKSIVALKDEHDAWWSRGELMTDFFWRDEEVTLICPLTPERPGKDDLQAKYDVLEQKYAELDRKYFDLSVELSIEQQANGSRNDWGDEQPEPAWRIEAHNPDNFRVGEYIIDIDGDSGTVTPEWIELWDTDEDTFGARRFAPFIVFPNKAAATPEAVEEATNARDKETGE